MVDTSASRGHGWVDRSACSTAPVPRNNAAPASHHSPILKATSPEPPRASRSSHGRPGKRAAIAYLAPSRRGPSGHLVISYAGRRPPGPPCLGRALRTFHRSGTRRERRESNMPRLGECAAERRIGDRGKLGRLQDVIARRLDPVYYPVHQVGERCLFLGDDKPAVAVVADRPLDEEFGCPLVKRAPRVDL